MKLETAHLLVARHVRELRQRSKLLDQLLYRLCELSGIGILKNVLILCAACPRIDLEILRSLEEYVDAFNSANGFPQAAYDLTRSRPSGLSRLEDNVNPAGIGCCVDRACADKSRHAFDIRILAHGVRDGSLQCKH